MPQPHHLLSSHLPGVGVGVARTPPLSLQAIGSYEVASFVQILSAGIMAEGGVEKTHRSQPSRHTLRKGRIHQKPIGSSRKAHQKHLKSHTRGAPRLWFIMHSCLLLRGFIAQSCPTLGNPMDYSPPGSSVHGILQARILEWVAIPFSRRSS